MTPLGFLVLIPFVLIFVNEAMKNSGHGNSRDISQVDKDDVLRKRENFSADDRYGADDPGEYYSDNAGRFENYSEACYYYHMAHMGHDNTGNE